METLPSGDAATAYEEHLDGRIELALGDGHHIGVEARLRHHLLAFDRLARGEQLVAPAGRVLELHAFGRFVHLAVEALQRAVDVAVEEASEALDVASVLLLRHLTDARARAPSDVEVQARTIQSVALVEQRLGARPHREDACEQVDRFADRIRVRVRPEVLRAAALATAHHGRLRPCVVQGDGEVRVGLVVPVPDVVARLVLLDQRVLEKQRLHLAGHDDPIDAPRGRHQRLRPREEGGRCAEVVRHPLADAARLADVEHPTVCVSEQVHARTIRQLGEIRPLSGGEVQCLEVQIRDGHQIPACSARCAPQSFIEPGYLRVWPWLRSFPPRRSRASRSPGSDRTATARPRRHGRSPPRTRATDRRRGRSRSCRESRSPPSRRSRGT